MKQKGNCKKEKKPMKQQLKILWEHIKIQNSGKTKYN